jgi:hypothetical protein
VLNRRSSRLQIVNKTILILLATLLAVPLFFVSLGQDPTGHLVHLNGPAHVVFFAVLAGTLARLGPLDRMSFPRQIVLIMAILFVVGGAIELIQPHFGRNARWRDLGFDLIGGLAGLLFTAPGRHAIGRVLLRAGQSTAVALALAVVAISLGPPAMELWDEHQARRQFPVIADFETRFEESRWSGGTIEQGFARNGNASLRVVLGSEQYSGATLRRRIGDWEGYSALELSIHNPGPVVLTMNIVILDEEHRVRGSSREDRFVRRVQLEQGWNDLRIPLEEIENAPEGRTMDLSRIRELSIRATARFEGERVIHVDRVRLTSR